MPDTVLKAEGAWQTLLQDDYILCRSKSPQNWRKWSLAYCWGPEWNSMENCSGCFNIQSSLRPVLPVHTVHTVNERQQEKKNENRLRGKMTVWQFKEFGPQWTLVSERWIFFKPEFCAPEKSITLLNDVSLLELPFLLKWGEEYIPTKLI